MNGTMNLEVRISSREILVRDINDDITLVIDKQMGVQAPKSVFRSYGVYGMVTMNQSSYIIFVVAAIERGLMHEHMVYEVKDVEVVQVRRGDLEDFSNEVRNLRDFFRVTGIYFSIYPLHRTISVSKGHDTDFLFNLLPLKRFFKYVGEAGVPFSMHCIQGFFGAADVESVSLRLISRRSWRRTGARYFCRGSDTLGYVSNYVETEQIVYDKEKTVSYLQIRGSIPLMWRHVLGREYNPKILVNDKKILHIADKILEDKYGRVLYLNLIRDAGYEKTLYDVYERELAEGNKRSVHFNFSKEGGILEGPSRKKFLELIEDTLVSFGYFDSDKFQSGVIRTNCIDCLDRTNISQFIMGEIVFRKQIGHFSIDNDRMLNEKFRYLWHENGNTLSMQYSGSFALKTYFLNNQRRGIVGRFRDTFIGLRRYFVNRFYHGSLQTTYDILTTECEGKDMGTYRDGMSVIRNMLVFSLLVIWSITWVSTDVYTLKLFLWNGLATIFAMVIVMVVFLEFFIQKPRKTRGRS